MEFDDILLAYDVAMFLLGSCCFASIDAFWSNTSDQKLLALFLAIHGNQESAMFQWLASGWNLKSWMADSIWLDPIFRFDQCRTLIF